MENVKDLVLQDVVGCDDITVRRVHVPEWKGWITVRSLGADERDDYDESLIEERKRGRTITYKAKMRGARARLVVRTAVIPDESLRPDQWPLMFDEGKHLAMLGMKNGKAVDRLYEAAAELCGIRDEDIEEALGNSETDPSDSASGE